MRRLIFWVMMIMSIGFATYVVLFQSGFWSMNLTGGSGKRLPTTGNGWDMIYGFFRNIGDSSSWGTTSAHFVTYALIAYVLIVASVLLSLVLTLAMNLGLLGRSRRLYRTGPWFLFATIIITGFYIWLVFDMISMIGAAGTWSIRTLPVWFYVPIGLGLVTTIFSAIFKNTEVN